MEEQKVRSNPVIAGAVTGFLTRLICQPLDVIKIRFQLQVEPITNNRTSKYRSLWQATSTIVKEEKIFALWKGHVPAQLLSISYGILQFYSYNESLKLLNKIQIFDQYQSIIWFLAGANAGCIATIGSFPFDVARTRLVAQASGQKIYDGILSCYVSILRTESIKTLFYGLSPTLLQVAPQTALNFFFYNLSSKACKHLFDESKTSVTNSLISGSIAGLCSKTAIYPLDVARKRMQIQGFERGRQGFGKFFTCQGLFDCLIRIAKTEGIPGLFKGLIPSQLKAAVTTALHFTFYEQTTLFLQNIRN